MMLLVLGAAVVAGLGILGLCASLSVLKACLEIDAADEAEQ